MKQMKSSINITKAEYIASAVSPAQFPEEKLMQIAFIGRSNVGKSSLINSLTRVHNLARVSGQPGKTQTINFFKLTAGNREASSVKNFYLVDLPGYGYARTGKDKRKKWHDFTKKYFLYPKDLYCVCQLIDIRHAPMASDIEMFSWFVKNEIPVFIIATKADKIGRNSINKNVAQIKKVLNIDADSILPYSSVKDEWRSHLLDFIGQALLE